MQHTNQYVYLWTMQDTRTLILQANYHAMRRHGFQGVRPDKVIAALGVTKGALYHYFPSKKDLGYAVVEEIISPAYLGIWGDIQTKNDHPIDQVQTLLNVLLHPAKTDDIALGCPLNNLIQEMSPLDEGFRNRLAAILKAMHRSLAAGLKRGVANQQVKPSVNPDAAAWMILSAVEGAFGLSKTFQDGQLMADTFIQLQDYLHTLRA